MRRSILSAVAFALALIAAVSLASPEPAQALSNPLSSVPNPLDLLPNSVPSLNPGDWIVEGFKSLLGFIFGDLDKLGKGLVNFLLGMPLLADEHAFPKLNALRIYIFYGSWGILSLSLVVASLRCWLSSYTGSGMYEGLIGFGRTVGAICLLIGFVPAYDQISRAINALTAAIIQAPMVADGLQHGIVGTIATGPIQGGGLPMIIGIFAVLAALFLLVIKVIITALLAVLYVASPLAIALYPVEELDFFAKALFGVIFALLLFPVIWALCFATFAVMSSDSLFPSSGGDVINALLTPMLTLALLIICSRLPFAVMELGKARGLSPGFTRGMRHVNNARSFGSSAHSGYKARVTPAVKPPVVTQGKLFH
jgi:hypothetical protein